MNSGLPSSFDASQEQAIDFARQEKRGRHIEELQSFSDELIASLSEKLGGKNVKLLDTGELELVDEEDNDTVLIVCGVDSVQLFSPRGFTEDITGTGYQDIVDGLEGLTSKGSIIACTLWEKITGQIYDVIEG